MSTQVLTRDDFARFAPSVLATEPHASRSNRYAHIPTIEVVDALAKAGFMPVRATQAKARDLSRHEYTKHLIRFQHESFLNGGKSNELGTIPEVALLNSHDGSSRYILAAGLLRIACLNGMLIAEGAHGEVRVRHTGNIVEEVLEATRTVIVSAEKSISVCRQWARIELTKEEQMVYAEQAHFLRFANAAGEIDTPIKPNQLLATRRPEDNKPDLWHTFNRVQENAIKGGLAGTRRNEENGTRRRVRTRAVQGIDQDVKLNRALWSLTEKMAELKSA